MTNDEQRVTEMAEGVGAVRHDLFTKSYYAMTTKKLLAFEQECIKRADKESYMVGVETGRTEYKDRLIAAEDEVQALREAGNKYKATVERYARQYEVFELAAPTREFDEALTNSPDACAIYIEPLVSRVKELINLSAAEQKRTKEQTMNNDEQCAGLGVEATIPEARMTNHRALSAVEQCNLQDELEASKLEVLALREALTNQFNSEVQGNMESSYNYMERVSKTRKDSVEALTNSEESAKRIKAGIEADVLEEVTKRHGPFGVLYASDIDNMAEERRAIAKGENNE